MKNKNELGKKYNRLTAVAYAGQNKWHNALWECRCDCGKITVVTGCSLRRGEIKSCGCLQVEIHRKVHRTHGEGYGVQKTVEYATWERMKRRCTNPNARQWKWYGGRGIKVCDRWMHSYENFLADMGRRPPRLSIDRINNDGNYDPSNCRWATRAEQVRNRSKSQL